MSIGWLDCTSGVSGDMLLGALAAVGALAGFMEVLAGSPELGAEVSVSSTTRGPLAAQRVEVATPASPPHRNRTDVQRVLDELSVPAQVRASAGHVFDRLAAAEARVHGVDEADVQFHEVGAVDAIVDVVGVCLGFHVLALDRLTVSPIAVGAGTAATQHGPVPLPGPAVLELLRDSSLVAHGETAPMERATPTGVALLAELADGTEPMPAMRVRDVGIGAGARDTADRPNVVRLVIGTADASADDWVLIEANVDDLDPRLWPGVLDGLLRAGAADAWLTPIVMKKGRPAHTVSALTSPEHLDLVRRVLFVESSTIGARTTRVGKSALARETVEVDVQGQSVRVKVARLDDGTAVSATPEWEDVSAAATTLGRPAKDVLAEATAAARAVLG